MILDTIFRLLYLVLWLFDVALVIYVLMSWLRPTANKWTEMLRKVVEPVLTPIRRILVEKLPPRWSFPKSQPNRLPLRKPDPA